MPSQTRAPSPTITEAPTPEEAGPGLAPQSSSGVGTGGSPGDANARDHVDGVGLRDRVDAAGFAEAVADDTKTADQLVAMASRLARFSFAEAATVTADDALMTSLAGRLTLDQLVMVLLYFRPDFPRAVRLAGKGGALTMVAWGRLVAGRTAEQCLAVVQDDAAWNIVRALPSTDPSGLFPNLALVPAQFQEALSARPAWLAWIVTTCGVERLIEIADRLGEFEADRSLREDMQTFGLYDLYVSLHPRPTADPREARRLYNWMTLCSDLDEGINLFQARFDWELQNEAPKTDDPATADVDETDPGATWDISSILRCWQICGRLPADQVLTGITVMREGETGKASGWAAGDDEMGMSWGTDEIGANEVGAFADDLDPMRGLNVFDSTFRHEIGHTVGFRNGFDSDGGFVLSVFGWKIHEFDEAVDELLGQFPWSADLTAEEQAAATDGIKAVTNYTEADFEQNVNDAGDAASPAMADLWTKVSTEGLADYLISRSVGGAWNNPADTGGRSYHVDYPPDGDWVSYPSQLWGKKVSSYAMRSPAEWFAEAYATFYAEADMPEVPVGRLLAQRDPLLYTLMLTRVHGLYNLANMTGQSMGHDTMGV